MKYAKYIVAVLAIALVAACSSAPVKSIGGNCNDTNYPQCAQGL
jgi:hypothetical protein